MDETKAGFSRRSLLKTATASAAVGALSPTALSQDAAVRYADIYPFGQSTAYAYPEQLKARYSAAAGQWGAAFSGGGSRAFSAALGQTRGLNAAGVLPRIGAISCVSGGNWFGSLFSFAPERISDEALLGKMVAPAEITVAGLSSMPMESLGARMAALSNESLLWALFAEILLSEAGAFPIGKVWSRVLNDLLLNPYGLAGTKTLFTLDRASRDAILARNPGLTARLQTARPGRPFFIAGATQISQPGSSLTVVEEVGLPGQTYRSFEYTPLYVGTPQFFPSGSDGREFGGGYVESFAFDTPEPARAPGGDVAAVPPGSNPFLLSDVVGSSSMAIAALIPKYINPLLKALGVKYQFQVSDFDYWPIRDVGEVPATRYSFGDGGIIENTGVVALLRRGYRTIFAFVNSGFPIGSPGLGCQDGTERSECVDGIDGQISRLFGLNPDCTFGTDPSSTQVFDRSQFGQVAAGLKAARAAGGAPVFAGTFPVIADNAFGIEPYTPQIFWIYNDLNEDWRDRLTPAVRSLLDDSNPEDYLKNFPNYDFVAQNDGTLYGFSYPEFLLLTPRQVNLLAHMWAYTVAKGFETADEAFGVPIAARSA